MNRIYEVFTTYGSVYVIATNYAEAEKKYKLEANDKEWTTSILKIEEHNQTVVV